VNKNSHKRHNEGESGRDRRRLHDHLLPRTGRRDGDADSDAAGPVWLVCFSDTIKGSMRQMFFVVLLQDGTVVVPRVEKRL
jgi:hypothetical protein